jgi:methionyl aminopeptidase
VIHLKSGRELEIMSRGGAILAATVALLERTVRAGISTWELDRIADEFIRSQDGARPSFKGLYGFPGSICTSINEEIVHGIPSRKRLLKEGDLLSLDVGVLLEGLHTDSATTVAVGSIDSRSAELLEVTRRALQAGVVAARIGNHVGDIGAAIERVVGEAGFSIVRDLVGHGIGAQFHEEPQVPNYGKPKRGVRLQSGMTLAIEPMVNIGRSETRTLGDRWTIVSADGSRSAHFEHTVAVTDDGPVVLTRQVAVGMRG